jgi:hypothetical protein
METTKKTDWLPEEWTTGNCLCTDADHEVNFRLEEWEPWFSGSDLADALTAGAAFYWNLARVHKGSAYSYQCAVMSLRCAAALEVAAGEKGPRVEAEKLLQHIVGEQIESAMLEAHQAGIRGEKKRAAKAAQSEEE